MEFDDPRQATLDKHAAQHGKYPEQDPSGHAELLKSDDETRQLTNFQSKFCDAKDPSVWGPGFMNICSTIAAIHMSDMSAQTNMLILNHREDSQSVIYVQLEDVGQAQSLQQRQLLMPPPHPPPKYRITKPVETVKTESTKPKTEPQQQQQQVPRRTEESAKLLKAKRTQMMMMMMMMQNRKA